jgi:hypothetical protein
MVDLKTAVHAEPGCVADLLAAIKRTWQINRVRSQARFSAALGNATRTSNLCHSVFRARGSSVLAWNRPSLDPSVPVTLVRSCPPTRSCPGILDRAILVLRHRACPGMRLGICCRFTNLTALRVSAVPQTPAAACINRNMRRPEGGRRLQTWNHGVKHLRPAQPSAAGSFIAAPPPQAVPGEVL